MVSLLYSNLLILSNNVLLQLQVWQRCLLAQYATRRWVQIQHTWVRFCLCSVQVMSNIAVPVFTWLINQDDLIAKLH